MAGHSKFKNIQHRKGAQDKKRAKIFTKLVREIVTAAKIGGSDIIHNPRLRTAINSAKAQNLPKGRIERALKQAADPTNLTNYTEIRYEAFIPGGIAFIIETLTDNKNRVVAEIRSALSKNGGNLAETGSVSFMFTKVGLIEYQRDVASEEEIMQEAIEAGADDVLFPAEKYVVQTTPESFNEVLAFLSDKYAQPNLAAIIWQPQNSLIIDNEEKAIKLLRLTDLLEESDDVQKIFNNYQIKANLLTKLTSDGK